MSGQSTTRALRVYFSLGLTVLAGLAGCPQEPPEGDARRTADTSTTLEGPGFTLTIPPDFELVFDDTSDPQYTYWRWYKDTYGDMTIAVGVLVPPSGPAFLPGSPSSHVVGAMQTAAGDFLLLRRSTTTGPFAEETESALGALSNRTPLVLAVSDPQFSSTTVAVARALFASVDLIGTDGYDLRQYIIDSNPHIVANASNGMIILDDESTWQLPFSATATQTRQVLAWDTGAALWPQTVEDFFGTHEELVHLGTWLPIEFEYLGQAAEFTIATLDSPELGLSDGKTKKLTEAVPTSWQVGDAVFLAVDDLFDEWIIHEQSAVAIRVSRF